jgi:hypothetical protein
MSADTAALIIVALVALPINAFTVLYAFTTPWWLEWIGRALLVSSLGLMLLVDISLLYNWLGDDYPGRDAVRLTVYTIICLGAWFKLIAYFVERRRARRARVAREYLLGRGPS